MSHSAYSIVGLTVLCCLAGVPRTANAGPCSDQIAELGKKLAQSDALGPPTTGTLTGAGPGSTPTQSAASPAPPLEGTSAATRMGGTGGTKEVNAAVGNQIATSPQDVRRQQQGLPTAAAVAAAGPSKSVETTPGHGDPSMPDRNMSEAKMELQRAVMLDHADDASCKQSIERTQQLMK